MLFPEGEFNLHFIRWKKKKNRKTSERWYVLWYHPTISVIGIPSARHPVVLFCLKPAIKVNKRGKKAIFRNNKTLWRAYPFDASRLIDQKKKVRAVVTWWIILLCIPLTRDLLIRWPSDDVTSTLLESPIRMHQVARRHLTPLNPLITLNLQRGLKLTRQMECLKRDAIWKVNEQTLCHIQNTPVWFLHGQWSQLIS